MAWKQIGNRSYYYQSHREGRRVVSEYLGAGELALIVERLDTLKRLQREDLREQDARLRASVEADERAIGDWFDGLEEVATGAMLAAGFHKHHGQWRRRRIMAKMIEKKDQMPASGTTLPEFRALVKQANAGDESAFNKLRDVYASGNIPDFAGRYRDRAGNPAWRLNLAIVDLASGENLALKAATEAKVEDIRRDLEGPNPTPIEKILAERAAQCWFLTNIFEARSIGKTKMSVAQANYYSRQLESANGRFLSAVTTLARVRKLALPSLLMRIKADQVNVGKLES